MGATTGRVAAGAITPPAIASATPAAAAPPAFDAVAIRGLEPGPGALSGRVSLDTIQDGGVDIGGSRLYTFDLTVSITGRSSYQTKFASVVPKNLVPRLMRGASFPAQIDPDQLGHLSIEWGH